MENKEKKTIDILIVEDEIITAKNLENRLENEQYRVIGIVSTGEEALAAARKGKPDIILMDISLKGEMDGITAATAIKAELDVPVIYMTAFVDDETVRRARLTAPFGYIVKPFQVRELRSNIEMALYKHSLETKLKESEARHRMVSELISDFVFAARVSEEGELLMEWMTGAYEQITGYSLEEAQEYDGKLLSIIHPEDRLSTKTMVSILKNENPTTLEYRIIAKNGEVRYLRNYLQGEWSSDGKTLSRIIGAAQDISRQRLSELRQEEQRSQLIQADKLASLGILVAGVAHEINNPNQTILMTGQFLKEAWSDIQSVLNAYFAENGEFLVAGVNYSEIKEELGNHFSWIEESARRIDGIVKDLREYALPDTSPDMINLNINMVVRSAVTLVSNMVKHATNRFSVDYGKNLPPIRGRFQKLEQVVINLIQNACQSLPDQDKAVSVSTVRAPKTKSVIITVQDEGTGIPEELLSKIKDPFFTTKRTAGGTGLGLSVSNSIVEELGGRLEFQSEPGKGTSAIITLPVNPD